MLVFDTYSYFLSSKEVHHYNTRLSPGHAYVIPNVRTNLSVPVSTIGYMKTFFEIAVYGGLNVVLS